MTREQKRLIAFNVASIISTSSDVKSDMIDMIDRLAIVFDIDPNYVREESFYHSTIIASMLEHYNINQTTMVS
jgi:propanediol dehydratase large subunit